MFEMTRKPDAIHAVMSSTLEHIDVVDQAVRELLMEGGLKSHIFSVSLVLREALTNAVRHGNKMDASKRVWFDLTVTADAIRLIIKDEGPGFGWQSLLGVSPDPSKDHGRGITIMQEYVTECNYIGGGNTIELVQKLA